MKRVFAVAMVASSVLAASTAANAIAIDISQAILAGGASFIGGGSKIKFDPNVTGESATFTLASIPGQLYTLSVMGQNNASNSFFQFLIDADGSGPGGFVQIGSNINFGSGFNPITLPTFTDIGTSHFFRIVNGGTGNTGGQITGLSFIAVPGPIVGAGLPGLLIACGGLVALARRRRRAK